MIAIHFVPRIVLRQDEILLAFRRIRAHNMDERSLDLVPGSNPGRMYGGSLAKLLSLKRGFFAFRPTILFYVHRSRAIALASPPPMHRQATPSFLLCRFNALIKVVMMRAPLVPIG